jgi:polysaccharide biosynthesis/export protein
MLKFEVLGLLLLTVLPGCAIETPKPVQNSSPPAALSGARAGEREIEIPALDELWARRSTNVADFPIGPGDILEISFPGLQGFEAQPLRSTPGDLSEEDSLGDNSVRVDGKGNVVVPLVGQIHVAGLSEEELRAELLKRMDRYMYEPEVEVFVKSYINRQAAVSGEVHSPGMYTVSGPAETIHDLVIRAGGMTSDAAQKIVLTPAKTDGAPGQAQTEQFDHVRSQATEFAAESVLEAGKGISGDATPYVVDFSSNKSAARYLNLPVRPGDMIYVPRAGTVTVTGWVYSPKSIDISPGLTVLGAVSTAGGALFAADVTHVKLLRQGRGQETETTVVNLNEVKAARTPDVLVQANDVIDVPYSKLRIPGYALYYGVQGLVSFAPAMLLVNGTP